MENNLSPPLPQDIALAAAQPPLPPDTLAQIVSESWVVAKGEGNEIDCNYGDDEAPAQKRRRTDVELDGDAGLFDDVGRGSIQLQMDDDAMRRNLFDGDNEDMFDGSLFEDLSSDGGEDDEVTVTAAIDMEEGEVQSEEESRDSLLITKPEGIS